MADTGAPHFIPYVEPTDLVRDYPAADEASAFAVAAALDAAGGLVAVKSAIFTGTQAASVLASDNVAITDLSITHEVSDPSNTVVLFGNAGIMANSDGRVNTGLAFAIDGALIGIGAADGSSTQVGAGGILNRSDQLNLSSEGRTVMFATTPGAGSKLYTLNAINVIGATRTVFVNRTESSSTDATIPRGASTLILMEVKV